MVIFKKFKIFVFGKRKITLDSSVIISDVIFNSEVAKEAVEKSTSEDEMMFTNIIFDECVNFTDKKNNKSMTKDEMEDELIERFGIPIEVDLPSDEELKKKYFIRDIGDLKILHSAEKTGSKLIVTRDEDLLDKKVKGPKGVKIVEMYKYVGKEPPPKKRK